MAMFEGEHPSYCPNGHFYDRDTPEGRLAREPLCGRGSDKFCAVLFANCGDLEHHWQGCGLENPGATAAGPCMFCRCNSSTRPLFRLHRHRGLDTYHLHQRIMEDAPSESQPTVPSAIPLHTEPGPRLDAH